MSLISSSRGRRSFPEIFILDITLVWRPLLAMLVIGAVYFAIAHRRFRRVIFGG